MDVKGANPFLFTEEEYTSPNAANSNSNPFLMEGDDFPQSGDNPFLSQTATTMSSTTSSGNATNPFAFDPMDIGPPEGSVPQDNIHHDFMDTGVGMSMSMGGVNPASQVAGNMFADDFHLQNDTGLVHQKPTELDLKFTAADDDDVIDGGMLNGPPGRPPVPPSKETQDLLMSVMGAMDATSSHLLDRIPPTRTPSPVSMRDLHSPSPTPEPQTHDLLDMTETVNQPSAQQQNVVQASDLLMGLNQEPDINQNSSHQDLTSGNNFDLLGQMSAEPVASQVMQPTSQPQPVIQPISTSTTSGLVQEQVPVAHVPPQRPGPPVRPPRPVPPQKPPPPAFIQHPPPRPTAFNNEFANAAQPSQPLQQPKANGAPPPKPPPPTFNRTSPPGSNKNSPPNAQATSQQTSQPVVATQPPSNPPKSSDMEMMDMFGVESTPKQKISTKDDILNLYNKPKEEPKPKDLLCDNFEMEAEAEAEAEKPVANNDDDVFADKEEESPTQSNQQQQPENQEEVKPQQETPEQQKTPQEPEIAAVPMVQDNFLSPEPSQADLQMDTSDSQSKGSVSSVTFNPFAAPEDVTPEIHQSPVANANIQDQFSSSNQIDNLWGDTQQQNTQQDLTSWGMGQVLNEPLVPSPSPAPAAGTDSWLAQNNANNVFQQPQSVDFMNQNQNNDLNIFGEEKGDDFDAFAAKFESANESKNGNLEAFASGDDAWGHSPSSVANSGFDEPSSGFGNEESFDAFLAMQEPPAVPQSTPNKMMSKVGSLDSDDGKDFNVFIRPKAQDDFSSSPGGGVLPILAPPPVQQAAFTDSSPRFNPFDQSEQISTAQVVTNEDISLSAIPGGPFQRTDSQETPPTPLFDDDVSQPLEDFPRTTFNGEGWEMQLRQPNKKKITGQRFWKKIFVKLVTQMDCVLLQLFNQANDKDPFQELPLQPCYSVSEIGAQQYDQFGKIFTLKLQYIFYKERPGVRPGQVKKAEKITNKLSQFAAYAIQGDYQGVKEFGSDLKKLGLPVEHAPQVTQLMKLGSLNYEDLKQFSVSIEESLFKLQAHRDRALHYKMEEVQITAVDELYVEQNSEGHVEKQIARVRLFFLGFLTGMPDVELGVNDMRRQGKEVVGRHDIIPVVTEEWIRLENVEFHNCVQQDEYENTHIIKFKPPDACYIELLRFRVRPPKNRELPLQLKPTIVINGNKIELRADVLVPGFASRKLGQVPCEDVMIRFPIPECWIYMFRVEKHFRYGSVKSAHRRTGKIKGIERILGTVDTLQESLIEVTSGQAKYEHQHRAIVWRCPRLPKEGQGAYTTHNMVCRLALTSYDQMPEQLAEYCYVEFTMPATQASHTTVRSVSLQNTDADEPPEKYVRYLARHEYKVGIEHVEGETPNAYLASTNFSKPAPPPQEPPKPIPEAEDSSSDSD